MNIDKTISDISLYHEEWILYVLKNAYTEKQRSSAEDFVQTMYCVILESTSFDCDKFYNETNQINKNYVFKILRSLISNDYRKKNLRTSRLDYQFAEIIQSEKKKDHQLQEEIIKSMKRELQQIPEGDILSLYLYEIPSIRKLSKKLGRSTSTIRIKINNCKELLKLKLYDYKEN
jgi:RNA polymerase sigma factor (sigma-70 family)|tara:strand:+ start:3951 stop:4475 length:525 start_codon:yes stop_codon:yes gene_type:complete